MNDESVFLILGTEYVLPKWVVNLQVGKSHAEQTLGANWVYSNCPNFEPTEHLA